MKRNTAILKKTKKKARRAIEFQLLSSFSDIFLFSSSSYPIQYQFLIFQGICNIAMWIFYLYPRKQIFSLSKSEKYLSQYSGLATAIILCLAVLPAGYTHGMRITRK